MPRFDVTSAFAREATRLRDTARSAARAKTRAVGTLARRLPVEARRDIQRQYTLRVSRIREGLAVRREEGAVVLIGRKRGIGLIQFQGRWRGRKSPGAVARIERADSPHTYEGTFIAAGRSGNRQIFERERKPRLPIRTLYGPSVAVMLRDRDRRSRLATFAEDTLRAEFERLRGRR